MKKTMKTVAVITSAAMLAGMAAGCKKETENTGNGAETLAVYFQDATTPDKALVEQELSRLTMEKIGVGVELKMFGPGEYAEKVPLLLASNEKMDIGFDAAWMAYVERARKGAYYDMTENLKTKSTELYNAIDERLWQGAAIDGKIYGVPTYKEIAERWCVYAEKSILDANGIDPESINSLKDAEVILEAMKKDPERAGFMILASNANHVKMDILSNFDTVSGDFVVERANGNEIVNYYMTPQYEQFVRLMRDWYEKGYISSDVATRENYDEYTKHGDFKHGLSFVSYAPFNEVGYSATYNTEFVPMDVTPTVISNDSTRGSIFGVYKKSKNPEKAMEFLQLWNTTPEIKNLITYGIEGKHYNLEDGKVVKVPDAVKMYSNQNWCSGNTFISYLLKEEPDNKYEVYDEFNNSAISSLTLGFTPDLTSVSDKVAACSAVVKEYSPLLNVGAVDIDENIGKFRDALKNSGVDEITAEIQKQYDAWKN